MKKKTAIWLPFIIAISIVLGICIGRFYHQASTIGSRIFAKQNKIETLLSIIQSQYVDTVNINKLVENAMPKIIGELDPHSAYIPAKDLLSVNEELEGSFSGIGIQFSILNDTDYGSQCYTRRTIRKSRDSPGRPNCYDQRYGFCG